MFHRFWIIAGLLVVSAGLQAAAPLAEESAYYVYEPFPLPAGLVAEVGAIELLPDGKVAFGTRRGDIWLVTGIEEKDLSKVTYQLYAEGLHEVLGLAWRDGWLYVTQRPEVSRLKDKDGDGRADVFETVNADWAVTGDYHEYAFGSRFDPNGNLWVALTLTGSFHSDAPYRGWAVRVTPDGKCIPTAAGLRSPGGIGLNPEGDVFYTDNQGVWNGSSSLKWLKPGSFQGHPETLQWWDEKVMGSPKPLESANGTRVEAERARNPLYVPPAVILPHGRLGHSPTGWDFDESGKFGPFKKQLIMGELSFSTLDRVYLEKVNGVYQGAAFEFLKGLHSGPIAVRMAPSGTLLLGSSDRGWGSRGGLPFDFARVRWTGKVPFEVLEMRARPEGFALTFTQPVDVASAKDAASYEMEAWTYIWQESYGSPEVDPVKPKVEVVSVSEDGLQVELKVTPLTKGHVHALKAKGLKSRDEGLPLLHPVGYYTLNEIPR